MPIEKDMSGAEQAKREKKIPIKGEKLVCDICGLSLVIDEVSGSLTFEEPVCCGKPMKLQPSPVKKPSIAMKPRGRQAGSSRYQG